MSFADIADAAGDNAHDDKIDALVAWLHAHDERLAKLQGATEPIDLPEGPLPWRHAIARLLSLRSADRRGFNALLNREEAPDVPLSQFRKPRFACKAFTFFYFLTWVAVHATLHEQIALINGEDFDADVLEFHQWASTFEFMSTGLAETACVADLLLTLPSKDGGAAAVRHFIVYEAVFAIGAAFLYGRFAWHGVEPDWTPVGVYLLIHVSKAAICSAIFLLVRRVLYARFADRRFEQAAKYFASLLNIAGVQILLFMLILAGAEDGAVSVQRLLAATTLSVSLPQAFILMVCVRDAKTITSAQIVTLGFSCTDTLAMFFVTAYTLVGVFSYFLAVTAQEQGLTLMMDTRYLYYGACATYVVATAVVGVSLRDARAELSNVFKSVRGGLRRMSLRKGGQVQQVYVDAEGGKKGSSDGAEVLSES